MFGEGARGIERARTNERCAGGERPGAQARSVPDFESAYVHPALGPLQRSSITGLQPGSIGESGGSGTSQFAMYAFSRYQRTPMRAAATTTRIEARPRPSVHPRRAEPSAPVHRAVALSLNTVFSSPACPLASQAGGQETCTPPGP